MVVGLALVQEELVRPHIARPEATEAGVDILVAIPIEVRKDDAVALLNCTEAVEHRDIVGSGALATLGSAEEHLIRQDVPALGPPRAEVPIESPIVVEVAEVDTHRRLGELAKIARVLLPIPGFLLEPDPRLSLITIFASLEDDLFCHGIGHTQSTHEQVKPAVVVRVDERGHEAEGVRVDHIDGLKTSTFIVKQDLTRSIETGDGQVQLAIAVIIAKGRPDNEVSIRHGIDAILVGHLDKMAVVVAEEHGPRILVEREDSVEPASFKIGAIAVSVGNKEIQISVAIDIPPGRCPRLKVPLIIGCDQTRGARNVLECAVALVAQQNEVTAFASEVPPEEEIDPSIVIVVGRSDDVTGLKGGEARFDGSIDEGQLAKLCAAILVVGGSPKPGGGHDIEAPVSVEIFDSNAPTGTRAACGSRPVDPNLPSHVPETQVGELCLDLFARRAVEEAVKGAVLHERVALGHALREIVGGHQREVDQPLVEWVGSIVVQKLGPQVGCRPSRGLVVVVEFQGKGTHPRVVELGLVMARLGKELVQAI